MLSFTDFLIEKSLDKVDALLRLDPAVGLQPGYLPVTPFLGPRASASVCQQALHLLDRVKTHDAPVPSRVTVNLRSLQPTQHTIYLPDVKDIARKQNFEKPIAIFRSNGHLYILNGHHRAAAAALVQRPSITADLYES